MQFSVLQQDFVCILIYCKINGHQMYLNSRPVIYNGCEIKEFYNIINGHLSCISNIQQGGSEAQNPVLYLQDKYAAAEIRGRRRHK